MGKARRSKPPRFIVVFRGGGDLRWNRPPTRFQEFKLIEAWACLFLQKLWREHIANNLLLSRSQVPGSFESEWDIPCQASALSNTISSKVSLGVIQSFAMF